MRQSEYPAPPNAARPLSTKRQRVLELARNLDRFGRKTQQSISMQLQQLELAIADFERERAAWRRLQQRDAQQVEQLRGELPQHTARSHTPSETGQTPAVLSPQNAHRPPESSPALCAAAATEQLDASSPNARLQPPPAAHPFAIDEALGRGDAPLRLLLQPGTATNMQIGLLMFEASKLNREVGGQGVRFEITDCRICTDQQSQIGDQREQKQTEETAVLELEAFSCAPLTESENDLQHWEAFTSCLLLSSLVNPRLDRIFRDGRPASRDHAARLFSHDAALRAFDANTNCYAEDRRYGPVLRVAGDIDTIRQQLICLEQVAQLLEQNHGLQIHVSLV